MEDLRGPGFGRSEETSLIDAYLLHFGGWVQKQAQSLVRLPGGDVAHPQYYRRGGEAYWRTVSSAKPSSVAWRIQLGLLRHEDS